MQAVKKHNVLVSFTLGLFLSLYFASDVMAAVLYEQSNIGTAYDLLSDAGSGYGFYGRFPQYSGTGSLFPGGGTAYAGTVDWLRVKRLSGVGCEVPTNIHLYTTTGLIEIGKVGAGSTIGPFCDFPITGPDRTDMSVGVISMCVNNTCNDTAGTMVLDGSPSNLGYVFDGTQTLQETGGWAFQLCDAEGCAGGFEETPATTTPKQGASSVLFLPGIMGSRLYEDEAGCTDDSGEQERWFSTNECDQLRLKTDFTGKSLYSLYTKPLEDSVIDSIFLVSPLYKNFLQRLAEEKENEVIADYKAIPYDWRLTLDDILKTRVIDGKIVLDSSSTYQQSYLYTSLQELVSNSDSGKVTIIAHSNGGLLAKALILKMQVNNDPLLVKIDNLILVGVPQTGTPESVAGLLQGTDILGGIIINNVVSRDIVNTAPFGHHLLPSEEYFDGTGITVETPVLQFQVGSISGVWRDEYGESISNHEDLKQFLSNNSGRMNPDRKDLSQPEVVDNFLLDYAEVAHSGQSSFVPSSTMKVSQVAGVGVSTLASLVYFTDKECVKRSLLSFFTCTEYRDKLGYSVRMVADGDGTVVTPSALAMSENDNVERIWMDLFDHNDSESDREHRNILETTDIQNFILNTIEATTSRPYTYLEQNEIIPKVESRLVFQLHSPLDMWVSADNGVVSSSTVEIPSALYKRIGEVQYIEVPATEEEVDLHMVGQATGSFTLEVEKWRGSVLEDRIDYVAVPTATSTIVTAKIIDKVTSVRLKLDQEGDGIIEGEMTQNGEFIATVVSYRDLTSAINALNLNKTKKQALLALVKTAELYGTRVPIKAWHLTLEDLFLKSSEDLLRLYVRKRLITQNDAEKILGIIKVLKNKQ